MSQPVLSPKILAGRIAVLKDQIDKTGQTDATLSLLTSQLQLETVTEPAPNEFWNQLSVISQQLSKECTKVAISYSKSPVPTGPEADALLQKVETASVALCSVYFSAFPKANLTLGATCWTGIRRWMSAAIGALNNFLETLPKGPQHVQQLLSGTGAVWEICDSLQTVPQNNQIAVRNQASEALSMVDDALNELKEEASNDPDEMDEKIGQVLNNSLGMCKTAKATLRTIKSLLAGDSTIILPAKFVSDLDLIAEALDSISPAIDDLAGAFYELSSEDTSRPLIEEAATTKNTIEKTLHILKCSERFSSDKLAMDKIEFLEKALEHNYSKLTESISALNHN